MSLMEISSSISQNYTNLYIHHGTLSGENDTPYLHIWTKPKKGSMDIGDCLPAFHILVQEAPHSLNLPKPSVTLSVYSYHGKLLHKENFSDNDVTSECEWLAYLDQGRVNVCQGIGQISAFISASNGDQVREMLLIETISNHVRVRSKMCKFYTFENSTMSEKNSACNECVRFPEENPSVTSRTPVQTEAPWPIKVEPRNGQMSGKSYLESVQKAYPGIAISSSAKASSVSSRRNGEEGSQMQPVTGAPFSELEEGPEILEPLKQEEQDLEDTHERLKQEDLELELELQDLEDTHESESRENQSYKNVQLDALDNLCSNILGQPKVSRSKVSRKRTAFDSSFQRPSTIPRPGYKNVKHGNSFDLLTSSIDRHHSEPKKVRVDPTVHTSESWLLADPKLKCPICLTLFVTEEKVSTCLYSHEKFMNIETEIECHHCKLPIARRHFSHHYMESHFDDSSHGQSRFVSCCICFKQVDVSDVAREGAMRFHVVGCHHVPQGSRHGADRRIVTIKNDWLKNVYEIDSDGNRTKVDASLLSGGYRVAKDNKILYECAICLRQSHNWDSIRACYNEHGRIWNLREEMECPLCQKNVIRSKITHHFDTEHLDTLQQCCARCGHLVEARYQLRKHQLEAHGGDYKTRLCNLCGHQASNAQNLAVHIARLHEKNFSWLCPTCGSKFKSKRDLSVHQKTKHGSLEYKCPSCDTVFGDTASLKNHLRIHVSVKPFSCSTCSYSSYKRNHVANHVKSLNCGKNGLAKGHVTVDKILLEQQKRMVKAQLDKVKPEAKNASTDATS